MTAIEAAVVALAATFGYAVWFLAMMLEEITRGMP